MINYSNDVTGTIYWGLKSKCVKAFERGNKQDAERLLLQIGQPADIRTTTYYVLCVSWSADLVSLLHLAAHHSWIDIIIDLITKYKCDTNCKDSHGRTPLHYAASNNHLEVVRYFSNEQHCDPMTKDNNGDTPLNLACRNGHLNIAEYLIFEAHCNVNNEGPRLLHLACHIGNINIAQYLIKEGHCNPSCVSNDGETPLHIACCNGHLNIAQYLIREAHCNPSYENKNGDTPLHVASRNGHLNIAEYLIFEAHCNVDNEGSELFHLACSNGHLNTAQYLIREAHCNPSCENKNGDTPLHLASRNGHLNIAQYLIFEEHCNVDNKGSKLLLHSACRIGNINIVQYLVREAHCDPSCEDSDDNTPLHVASLYGHTQIVQFLLSTGKVDPLAKNKYGSTAVDWASRKPNNYNVLKLFQSFPQCERDFPVHTYTKLVLTGYSGAGKTTISQLILLLANETGFFSWLSSGCVTDVECLTAGIIPLHVESKVNEVGNMVIYDFAGQQEYYSSHAAVLERIMRNSAAIFVCIVDLSQCMDKISESIHYWISFIENACSSVQGSSHVIIVGSHADLVKSSQELKEKSSLVESIAESRVKKLTYGGFVSMDCRLSKTKEAHHFRTLLSTSQQAILSYQPSMSLYCHMLYAFLSAKLGKTGCTLQELTSALALEEYFYPNSTVLTELLTSLSDKGLILFVQNQEHPQSSWVVVEKEALLRDVNGTLFAPHNFKQYRQVASNTGIVPTTTLEELFPQYSSEMLVGCLESMEFCHPEDPSALQATNLTKLLHRLLYQEPIISASRVLVRRASTWQPPISEIWHITVSGVAATGTMIEQSCPTCSFLPFGQEKLVVKKHRPSYCV